jgi:branched-chain amino acid aminotransferase
MMQETEWIAYVNGEYVLQREAKLSIFDHGVLYGDGVFDAFCAWNGQIFKIDQHIDRLFRSLNVFQIDMSLSKEDLKKIVVEVVQRNREKNQYIKCIVTRGVGPRPLLSPAGCKTSVVVFSRPYLWLSASGSALEKGVKARISNMRAIPAQCMDHKSKNLNYAHFVLIKMEALSAGADEAIILDIDGFVNEGPGYNIFVINQGKLFTPSSSEGLLAGITRETVFEIAEQAGIEVIENRITPYDVFNADEVFFSSTAGAIIPVVEVDGRKIASGTPGPITKRVYELYFEMLDKGVHGTPF